MNYPKNNSREAVSTYALLVGSEDKEQSVSETAAYLLLILCAAFSLWFAARQPVKLPLGSVIQIAPYAQTSPAPHSRV